MASSANYTIKSPATGSYISFKISPAPESTVFSFGDEVTITGSIYNGNNQAIKELWVRFGGYRHESIAVNVDKGKTAQFSAKTYIVPKDVSSNPVVGINAKAALDFMVRHSDTTLDTLYRLEDSDSTSLRIEIIDPTVPPKFSLEDVLISDLNGRLEYFGNFIQGKSACSIDFPIESVTTDPNGQLSGEVMRTDVQVFDASGNEVYSFIEFGNYEGAFDAGEIFSTPGDYLFTISVKGAYGKTNTQSKTMIVLPYTAPVLSALGSDPVAVRYQIGVDDYGETTYTPSMTGTLVLFKYDGDIADLNGKNTWSLSLDYDLANTDAASMTSAGVVASGTESDPINRDYPDTFGYVIAEIPPTDRYKFTFTLTDYFGETAVLTGYVDKATAVFNVRKNGVAVGMLSTGQPGSRKFEVDENYESLFYGGIHGVTNYTSDEIQTGGRWIDNKPIYRKTIELPPVDKGTTTTASVATVSDDIGRVIDFYGTVQRDNGVWYPLVFQSLSSQTGYAVDCYVKGDGGVVLRTGTSTTLLGGYMVCLYTKESDEPIVPDDGSATLLDANGIALADADGTTFQVEAYNADYYYSKYTGVQIDTGLDRAYNALPITGGTMTGALFLYGDPATALEAATKQYVDRLIEQIELTPGDKGEAGIGITDITITEVV